MAYILVWLQVCPTGFGAIVPAYFNDMRQAGRSPVKRERVRCEQQEERLKAELVGGIDREVIVYLCT